MFLPPKCLGLQLRGGAPVCPENECWAPVMPSVLSVVYPNVFMYTLYIHVTIMYYSAA